MPIKKTGRLPNFLDIVHVKQHNEEVTVRLIISNYKDKSGKQKHVITETHLIKFGFVLMSFKH